MHQSQLIDIIMYIACSVNEEQYYLHALEVSYLAYINIFFFQINSKKIYYLIVCFFCIFNEMYLKMS